MAIVSAPSSCIVSEFQGAKLLTVPAGQIPDGEVGALSIPGVQAFMALERRGLYWNRSKVGGKSFAELDQVQFLIAKRADDFVLLLPLVSGNLRAHLRGSGNSLSLVWEGLAPEEKASDAALLLACSGDDAIALAERGVRLVRDLLGTFRLREEKSSPEFVDYLGWCTWDAFYHSVTAAKVIEGIKSFADGGLTPGFVILDDGWLDVDENEYLRGFAPNREKFPEGLAPMITAARRDYGIRLFGIWHAFEGYWRGIQPDGPLGKRFRTVRNVGDIRPWAPKDVDLSLVHPDDVYGFFQEFHDYLRRQGADFVKVDGQSALEIFTRNKLGLASSMRAFQYAFQGSIQTHFRGNAISCMSNGSDVAYHMLAAPVWRNSQDFFPKDPASHGKHVLWNAMNSLWASQFCIPDWDMFWSSNPEGEFHAMARAISGGPVYVSDKPESHDFAILKKLTISNARILRSDRPALPSSDCIFTDCTREERLLKITNRSGKIGVIGLFNCRDVDGDVSDSLAPADVHDIRGKQFAVYLHKAKQLSSSSRKGKTKVSLPRLSSEIAIVSPILGDWIAPLGLIEKYNAPAAVTSCKLTDDGECIAHFQDGGLIGFWCKSEPTLVAVSRKSKISYSGDLLTIQSPIGQPIRVQVTR